ncbi:MAG TPA: LPS assembly protein LptD, partial [Devosia sp.]|nr:LPS assembly protein LptD [Devosia sp.]
MAAAPGTRTELLPRRLIRGLAGFAIALALAGPAEASLLPAGFFDMDVKPGQGSAAVEADRMTDDAKAHLIIAEGNATVSYGGSVIKADRIEYDQNTGGVHAIGHVVLRDHAGDIYQMNEVTVTGGMKQAFINSLTLTTHEGSLITADNVNYSSELQTILTDATYSPCGLCIDSKGRHIGWQVKAARMVYDRKSASITMDQPSLAVLGIPVAWLPWFWLPDPTQPRAAGIRLPSVDYDPKRGAIATLPYFQPIGPDIDMLLSPTLMSRQGFLGKVRLDWRLPDYGEVDVRASGIDQLTPSAYAGTVGDRSWRGAIQTSGSFKPLKDWTAGWSYSAFSDGDYLYDYEMDDSESSTNDVHVTYLHQQTWFDARIETFNRLGTDLTAATDNDNQQAVVLPKVSADHVQDLAPGWGRVHVTAEALGVDRGDDDESTFNGVPYDFGYAGAKQHAMVQGNWENQWILPGGVTAVPYVGMRLDAAEYDGASTLPSAPPATFLLSATPIAAMDVRWPLMAVNGSDTHLLEPIAQLVYRGS